MIDQELCVYNNNKWSKLVLIGTEKVKYNVVVNKIGDPQTRSIKHSNTFKLPNITQNISALGLNIFNPYDLSTSLNKKFKAKILYGTGSSDYALEGWLVINNIDEKSINVNMIDESLELLDAWGDISYRQMLNEVETDDSNPELTAGMENAIKNAKVYDIPASGELENLWLEKGPLISDFPLAIFPNSLNVIGDKFNIVQLEVPPPNPLPDPPPDTEYVDVRCATNKCNALQSRPIFQSWAMLELACRHFGYTPVWDQTIDQQRLKDEWMISKGVGESKDIEKSLLSAVNYNLPQNSYVSGGGYSQYILLSQEAPGSLIAEDIAGWADPNPNFPASNFSDTTTVYPVDIEFGIVGTMRVDLEVTIYGGNQNVFLYAYAIWNPISPGPIIAQNLDLGGAKEMNDGVSSTLSGLWNKSVLTPPIGSNGILIGIQVSLHNVGTNIDDIIVHSSTTTETYSDGTLIPFDEQGQFYKNSTANLLNLAPDDKVKKLVSGVLERNSILLDVDYKNKEVRFFTYSTYRNNLTHYLDWSKYILKGEGVERSKNYGNSYGRINTLSLSSPYSGNTVEMLLTDKEDSRLPDEKKIENRAFKDVSKIDLIGDSGLGSRFEYTNKGLGLVHHNLDEDIIGIDTMDQIDYNNNPLGTFRELRLVSNILYSEASKSTTDWYKLVKDAPIYKAKFTLPHNVALGVNLSLPIYIEHLGGYHIIEEIDEYVDPQTPVEVTLIKMLSGNASENLTYIPTTDGCIVVYNNKTGEWFLNGTSNIEGEFGRVVGQVPDHLPYPHSYAVFSAGFYSWFIDQHGVITHGMGIGNTFNMEPFKPIGI